MRIRVKVRNWGEGRFGVFLPSEGSTDGLRFLGTVVEKEPGAFSFKRLGLKDFDPRTRDTVYRSARLLAANAAAIELPVWVQPIPSCGERKALKK